MKSSDVGGASAYFAADRGHGTAYSSEDGADLAVAAFAQRNGCEKHFFSVGVTVAATITAVVQPG